ncbi:MAG: alanine racemase [Elusimicrobia bacterium]|nr:alanine racemase [Elusimicrobiota bacterium]
MQNKTCSHHEDPWSSCWNKTGVVYRPTWVEIDQAAFRQNIKNIQRYIGAKTSIIAVVKANAYGHQAVPLARCAVKAGVKILGVSSIEEGITLREAGISAPILILGSLYPLENLAVALRHRLIPTVSSFQGLQEFSRCAKRQNIIGAFHLKIDTGMGRIGISPNNALRLIDKIVSLKTIKLDGIYTHFSSADTDAVYTRQQQEKLSVVAAYARKAGLRCMVHAANSAAFLKQKNFCCDAVRPGLSMYGLLPFESAAAKIKVKPVLSWKTHIVFLKRVPRQTSISYDRTFVTKRMSVIATLPVGYADGYNRLLSNKGSVLVRGVRCPVVGKVTMDMIMVDVTAVPAVAIGDEAVLIGSQGKKSITVEEMARAIGTISYEITCAIGARVPRILI